MPGCGTGRTTGPALLGYWKGGAVARRTGSYKFDKRRRELAKQKKRQEKLERKQRKGLQDDEEYLPEGAGSIGLATPEDGADTDPPEED